MPASSQLSQDTARLKELADFLRRHRTRLKPVDLGLKTGRRRVPGLRREEVAARAGISTLWYMRLEQGRPVRPSAEAVRRLGQALCLSTAEQAYLMRLARPDLAPSLQFQDVPSPALLALLEGLSPHPAYLLDAQWHLVALNSPARHLLGAHAEGQMLLRLLFLDEHWRRLFADWAIVARSAVAQFRAAAPVLEPVSMALIAALAAESREFAALWAEAELADPPVWRKRLLHSQVGEIRLDFASLRPGGPDSRFTLSLHTPADAASRAALLRLV